MHLNREDAKKAIREKVDCRQYLKKSKGGLYVCPYCHSGEGKHRTGALKVYDTNTWTCHACHRSGDVIDLIQEATGQDYNETLKTTAAQLGIEIDDRKRQEEGTGDKTPAEREKTPGTAARRAQGREITDYTQFYRECEGSIEDPAALDYLQARGISTETAARYGVGYCPAWISPAAARSLQAQGRDWRPQATPRLIFPVTANHYVARAIDPGAQLPKMNETGGGPAGIFNLQAIHSGAAVVFVTEGILDALSIAECGGAAVALNSVYMADVFLNDLQTDPTGAALVICLDNDKQGQEAAEKIGQGLDRLNVRHILADIAGGRKDPNEALLSDRAAFQAALEAAEKRAAAVEPPAGAQAAPQGAENEKGGEISTEGGTEAENGKDSLTAFIDKVQTRAYKPNRTGLKFIDHLLGGGIIRQSVILLLAAPGAGKTTLCQQIAEAMARNGQPFIYLNLEMSREQMLAKSISARAAYAHNCKLSALDVLQGYKWTDEQRRAVLDTLEDYRANVFPFLQYNPDGVGSDLQAIREYLQKQGTAARQAHRRAPAIVLDYLHIVSTKENLETQELIKQTMEAIKGYCMTFDTFALVISATNRTTNSTGKITLESGRDSSNLEYGADAQISLNYEAIDSGKVSPGDPEKVAELQRRPYRHMILRVLKARLYQAGRVATCYFHAETNRFISEEEFLTTADPEEMGAYPAREPARKSWQRI